MEFGDLSWKNLKGAFAGCKNFKSFSGGYTSNVTDMSRMFLEASNLTTLDLSNFDTSNIQKMSGMFDNASPELDVSKWNKDLQREYNER